MANRGLGGMVAAVLKAAAMLVVAPLLLAVLLVVLVFWLVATLTGIGPLLHYLCSKSDDKLLRSTIEPAPGAQVRLVPVSGCRHRLAVRWTPGDGSRPYQVCIPNGLGATLITVSKLHEDLAALGYGVLSYDRAGVGLSDPRSAPPGAPKAYASVAEVVAEMKEVMDGTAPGARWLLVGPSMGNIVAQCYVAAHPGDVAGVMNVDGFPFPFAAKRRIFESSGRVYSAAAAISRTGALRPALLAAAGSLAALGGRTFSGEVVRAQMNQANFYSSLAAEMLTMMDLADTARAAWGPAFDLVTADPQRLRALASAAPAACGDAEFPAKGKKAADEALVPEAWTWKDLPRSVDEIGGVDAPWTPETEARAVAIDPMLSAHAEAAAAAAKAGGAPPPPLPCAWRRLAVRAVSGRNYEKLGAVGGAFYDKQMREWAAAEHSMLVLVAARGARTVFPSRSHADMCIGLERFIAKEVEKLEGDAAAAAAAARSQSP